MNSLTFTMDVEDPRPSDSKARRYDLITRRVLEELDHYHITGTFFIVGALAQKDQNLVRSIADAGHEVGLHSMNHVPLPLQNPTQFFRETRDGRASLQDITGQRISGYRAPVFSLTADTLWAPDLLQEAGFDYSSSILPARNPLFSFATAPRRPFRWPGGLLEIPAPVGRFGPLSLPYLGGIYFRYLPLRAIVKKLHQSDPSPGLWLYFHPHDFDPEERLYRLKDCSWAVSLLLWFRRSQTLKRFQYLINNLPDTGFTPPFAAQIEAGDYDDAPLFNPPPQPA